MNVLLFVVAVAVVGLSPGLAEETLVQAFAVSKSVCAGSRRLMPVAMSDGLVDAVQRRTWGHKGHMCNPDQNPWFCSGSLFRRGALKLFVLKEKVRSQAVLHNRH